ncbi:hypothetical protein OU994_14475 [Pseudoduganella sp. SL102]|uniref:hypothetical protein n=1 Tax=Pseudoduganella sp. SL102 TaxID=2995154 RepID=UPI00248BF8AB|nr:hypothetical protein [Pseudoduganella sp. SL102]WBS05395.1 hypothetical protein OU994_14475 [Pseudoduganella sp. SL102]
MNHTATSQVTPAAPEYTLKMRTLDEHLCTDQSFASALARLLGALAVGEDGAMTLAQFAAVGDLSVEGKASAVFTALVLNAIESGVTVDWAANALSRSSGSVEPSAREAAFAMMKPLLALQGRRARPLAVKAARALGIRLVPDHYYGLPPEEERRLLNNLGTQARKLVRGRGLVDAVADFGRSTGHVELLDHARGFNGGMMTQEQLRDVVQGAVDTIAQGIATYQEKAALPLQGDAEASALSSTADQLRQQVLQRLALVDARIAYERRMLWQDIDDAVHDAGNAIEVAIAERLDSEPWKDEQVWSGIARDQFAREMEHRLDRVARRKQEALDLLHHDLKLFQADMRITQADAFKRQHHAALARLMPRLRIGTRLVNSVDTAANLTLMGSAVAAAGTSTAAYLFGVAVVVPVVAPVVPFVGGAVLLASAFKWATDTNKRKREEIRDKRRVFEEELRRRLKEAEQGFVAQLDRIGGAFYESASALLTPLMLEAEAAARIAGVRKRIADKVIAQAQGAIGQLQAALAAAAPLG